MSQTQTCTTCGKAIKTGKSGSLTQWLLTVDACECNAPSLKLEVDETVEAPTLCEFCGKLRSDSRQGSLTQWVFGQDRCKCDLDKMYEGVDEELKAAYISGKNRAPAPKLVEPGEDETFIDRLEADDFEMHGLATDRFPFLRFRIIETIGKGNAGIVYECWDMTLRKRVAIKTISSQHYSPAELVRLQTEAKASSKLNHPNVMKILDFAATTGGQPYMVMELVRGTDLAKELETKGKLEPRRALEIFLQISAAVKHAHESGILHRDIKPSNIMLSRVKTAQGEVEIAKVIDFGIAAFNRNNTFKAEALDEITLVGSPLYMSPDQVNGLIFDERSDIYSIGCVMFESLSGVPPFKGSTAMETMKMHASCELPELSDTIPEPLVKVIKTALAKNPEERYQSVDQLIEALNVEMQFEPLEAAPEVVAEPTPEKSWKDNKLLFVWLPIALIAVLASSVLLTPRVPKQKQPVEIKSQLLDPSKGEKNAVDRTLKIPEADSRVKIEVNELGKGTKELAFTGNTREASVEEPLAKCAAPRVTNLSITKARVTERDIETLCSYPDLIDLSFDTVKIEQEHLARLSDCKQLTSVTIANSGITDSGLKQLGSNPRLFSITIDRNPEITAKGLSYLNKSKINELGLIGCGLDDTFFDELSKFPYMRNLYLGDNGVTDEQIAKLTNLKLVRLFGLNGSKVTDKVFPLLAKFPVLQTVYMLRCPGITKNGVKTLKAANHECYINTEFDEFMGTSIKELDRVLGDGVGDDLDKDYEFKF